MNFKEILDYRVLTLIVLIVFYGVYFSKMLIQRRKGIQTHQIGTKKSGSGNLVELVMSVATLVIVVVQLVSAVFSWHILLPSGARFTGFCVALIGDLLFLVSVTTMRDSWRAGIPAEDKTEFVSNGIYRFSRNPAFLSFDFMYIGVLLMFFNPLLLAFTLFAVVSLHLQILQEEKYLAQRFGEQYLAYKQTVFRYIGRR